MSADSRFAADNEGAGSQDHETVNGAAQNASSATPAPARRRPAVGSGKGSGRTRTAQPRRPRLTAGRARPNSRRRRTTRGRPAARHPVGLGRADRGECRGVGGRSAAHPTACNYVPPEAPMTDKDARHRARRALLAARTAAAGGDLPKTAPGASRGSPTAAPAPPTDAPRRPWRMLGT